MKPGDKFTAANLYFVKPTKAPGELNAPAVDLLVRPKLEVFALGVRIGNRFYPWDRIDYITFLSPAEIARDEVREAAKAAAKT